MTLDVFSALVLLFSTMALLEKVYGWSCHTFLPGTCWGNYLSGILYWFISIIFREHLNFHILNSYTSGLVLLIELIGLNIEKTRVELIFLLEISLEMKQDCIFFGFLFVMKIVTLLFFFFSIFKTVCGKTQYKTNLKKIWRKQITKFTQK